MRKEIQFRPLTNDDMGLLLQIYASTRELELQQTNWSDEQKRMFVAMQFEAQHSFYMEHYSDASFEIILHRDIPAGRLYLLKSPQELLVVDITLLPGFRGLGIGGAIFGDLMREAAETGRALVIHVERFNPALRLYTRLGFQLIEDKGVYLYMGWNIGGDQPISKLDK